VTDSKATTLEEAVSLLDKAREQAATMLEKIFAAAQPGAVYGQPVESGTYTVIAAAEVTSGGGFGMGMGLGPPSRPGSRAAPAAAAAAAQPEDRQPGGAGGVGGGGGSMGRPVAIIAVGPDGVTIKPVVDVTKVALAGLTAWVSMLGLLRAGRRARNR
jgi:uncharacterized spore protein YtfJ